jgi:thioredoxin-dependent peroxiredoxin
MSVLAEVVRRSRDSSGRATFGFSRLAFITGLLIMVGFFLLSPPLLAKSENSKPLQVGDKAPSFTLPAQDGSTVSLDDFHGKKAVVLYFYPQDDTLICKKEACLFRDSYKAFTEAGAEVFGVSSNSIESHKKFVTARHLPFKLLCDRGEQLRKMYGVPRAAGGFLPGRETFVIDRAGIIRLRFNSLLDAESHVSEALRILKTMDAKERDRVKAGSAT